MHDDLESSEPAPDAPLRPNMFLANASAASSTFSNVDFSHSVLTEVRLFNARLHQSNFEGVSFDATDFDGAVLTACSLRGVELVNCDVDQLVINGINIGNLMRLLHGTQVEVRR